MTESASPFARYRAKQRIAHRIARGWDAERAASTPALPRGRPPSGLAIVDRDTPYAGDVAAQLMVDAFPDGAPLEAIAEALGCSREGARIVLHAAVRSFRSACLGVLTERDLVEALARPGSGDDDAWDHSSRYGTGPARGAHARAEDRRVGRGPQSRAVIELFVAVRRAERQAMRTALRLAHVDDDVGEP